MTCRLSKAGLLALAPLLLCLWVSCSGHDGAYERPAGERGLQTYSQYFPAATRGRTVAPPEADASAAGVEVIESESSPLGYAVVERVTSRSDRFTVRVIMDRSFRVVDVAIVAGSSHSKGLRKPGFTGQFIGKGPDDPIRIGQDVDAVSRATMSSRGMAGAVRRAIARARRAASP